MPHGPVVNTQHGSICVLCRTEDPSADHQAWHNTSTCVGKFIKKSRRTDMITHLAQQHRVHSQVGAALADQWRYDSKKKHFSCGFCVAIFPSILERSNHIDNEHWRHGQNMDTWELSLLIRGNPALSLIVSLTWLVPRQVSCRIVEYFLISCQGFSISVGAKFASSMLNAMIFSYARVEIAPYIRSRRATNSRYHNLRRKNQTIIYITLKISVLALA